MRYLPYYILLLSFTLLTGGCIDESPFKEGLPTEGVSLCLKTNSRESAATLRGGNVSDATIDPDAVYVLLFEGQEDDSRLLDWVKAEPKTGNNYSLQLAKQKEACYAYIIANGGTEIAAQSPTWTASTTLKSVKESLLVSLLPQTAGIITAMPTKHPMCAGYELAGGISGSTNIGTVDNPVELTRMTVKLTVGYTGSGSHFELQGINLAQAPTQGYIFENVNGSTGRPAIPTAHYGEQGKIDQMMAGINPDISSETLPLYGYESLKTDETFVIVKGKFNSVEGYYRIDLLTDDKKEHLPLWRNYYYRITITRVYKAGYPTAQEAIDNQAENGLETTIEVNDPYSHEIISDGSRFLGVSNSELWIYDSYVVNEFNCNPNMFESSDWMTNYESPYWGNGFTATTLTYTTQAGWQPGKVTADNGIRFRKSETEWNVFLDELVLDEATDLPITRDIIITIPHDFKQGTVTIKVGPFEKKITIKRDDVISVIGDVIDLGTGYTTAKVDFSKEFSPKFDFRDQGRKPVPASSVTSAIVRLSTSSTHSGTATAIYPNTGDRVYAHIAPSAGLGDIKTQWYGSTPYGLSEFYLTHGSTQSRIKVHLVREGFGNTIKDISPFATTDTYSNAFWRNSQSGERNIIMNFSQNSPVRWTARVIYGTDFIRLAKSHRNMTTEQIRNSNAEDFQADQTWSTFLQCDFMTGKEEQGFRVYNPPVFRVALTSKNTTGKNRYGLILIQCPYARGAGVGTTSSFWIYVRQGETPEYIFSPSDRIDGNLCQYAQQISPFNLSVANPEDHPGGTNYTDHKPINPKGVFTQYPSQIGYLFQHGTDRAFHPNNPSSGNITGYTYDYTGSYTDPCPDGYETPTVDHSITPGGQSYTNTFYHSLGKAMAIRSYCADGYFDRINYPERNESARQEYLKPAWMQNPPLISLTDAANILRGGNAAYYGTLYLNPETLAGLFIPNTPNRDATKGEMSTTYDIYYWAKLAAPATDTKLEGLFSLARITKDRATAMPIRCVKK